MRINIVDVQKNTRKIRKTQQKKSSEGKERKIEDVILPPFYYIFVYQSNSINIPESFFTYRIVYPISPQIPAEKQHIPNIMANGNPLHNTHMYYPMYDDTRSDDGQVKFTLRRRRLMR